MRRDTCASLPAPVRAQPVLPGPSPRADVRGARRLVDSASPALRAARPPGRGSDRADGFRLVDPRTRRGCDRDRGPVARRAPVGLDARPPDPRRRRALLRHAGRLCRGERRPEPPLVRASRLDGDLSARSRLPSPGDRVPRRAADRCRAGGCRALQGRSGELLPARTPVGDAVQPRGAPAPVRGRATGVRRPRCLLGHRGVGGRPARGAVRPDHADRQRRALLRAPDHLGVSARARAAVTSSLRGRGCRGGFRDRDAVLPGGAGGAALRDVARGAQDAARRPSRCRWPSSGRAGSRRDHRRLLDGDGRDVRAHHAVPVHRLARRDHVVECRDRTDPVPVARAPRQPRLLRDPGDPGSPLLDRAHWPRSSAWASPFVDAHRRRHCSSSGCHAS